MEKLRKLIREIAIEELSASEKSSKQDDLDSKILDLRKQITGLQKNKDDLDKQPVTESEEQSFNFEKFFKNDPKGVLKIATKSGKLFWLNKQVYDKVKKGIGKLIVQNGINTRSDIAPGLTTINTSDIVKVTKAKSMWNEAADPKDAKRDEAVILLTKREDIRKMRDSGMYYRLPIAKFALVVKRKFNLNVLSITDILSILEKAKIR